MPTTTTDAVRSPEREHLLASVAAVKETVLAHAASSERERTLAPMTLAAFRREGLFRMGAPRVLGGLETDPVTVSEVVEEVARLDGSAAWSLMIGAQGVGTMGVIASDQAVEEIFGGDEWPATAGQIHGKGDVERVEGGYLFTGRWSFASGLRHANWLSFVGFCDGKPLAGFAPAREFTIEDDWHVAGLSGSGSCSFSAQKLFVPEYRTAPVPPRPLRGGPKYAVPELLFASMIGLSVGIAQRSLDEIISIARSKRRPFSTGTVADRPYFQHVLGELSVRLGAARAHGYGALGDVWEECARSATPNAVRRAALSASIAHTVETAAEVASTALRFGGSEAIYLTSALQRNARDLMVAAQHITVSEKNYESYGRELLGDNDEEEAVR